MTISTYSDLKTAIVSWDRDRSTLAEFADEIIDLAEAYLSSKLRVREMETTTSLTPTDNVCTLPSDFIEATVVVEEASIRRALEPMTKAAVEARYADRASGLSCNYMIVGDELTALPLSSNDIELTYYQNIPALTDSNTTNWLLDKMPNLYLHTCMMYAAELEEFNDKVIKEAKIVEMFVDVLQAKDERSRFGNMGVTLTGNVW